MDSLLSPVSPTTRIASTFSALKNSTYFFRFTRFSPESSFMFPMTPKVAMLSASRSSSAKVSL